MPIVRMPDGKLVRFPDDMPNNEIKAFISSKYENAYMQPMTDEQRAQAEQMASEMRPQRENVALGALTGFGEGLASGLSKVASGATLGATDWLDRRLGGNVTDFNKKLQRRAEATGTGGLNRVANFVFEMGGLGGGASKMIMKGAKTIPQLIGKGAVEGGIFGATASDSLGELARNIIGGVAVGGAGAGVLGAGGKMLKRLVPALNAEGKAKSLQDAFSDRDSVIALKRGAKTSQKLSDQIAEEMPIVKDNINNKMSSAVNQTIGEKPDIEGLLNEAKQGYADYMVMNANNPVNLSPLRTVYKKGTPFEKEALMDALKSANKETNSAIGTVDHTHQMRMAIDDAIDSASKKSNNRHVPSLTKLRKQLDEILKTDSGYKAIDDNYSQAMRVQKAYDAGYSATKKSKPMTFNNELERKAWLSGVNDNMQNNLVNTDGNYAKSVSDNLSILKNGLRSDEFNGLKKASNSIRKEYSRASGLDKIVNKESAAENRPFWREVLESIGSTVGAGVSGAEKAAYGLSDIKTANRILNGTADSATARKINNLITQNTPSISSLLAKRMADYEQ